VFVSVKHIENERIICFHWDSNQYSFRRVLPSHVNALGYLQVPQTTTLSQHPSVEEELASYTPRKINGLYFFL